MLQALGSVFEVFLLENVILKDGIKTIGAQNHFEPALQQDHIWDFGKGRGAGFLQRHSTCDQQQQIRMGGAVPTFSC